MLMMDFQMQHPETEICCWLLQPGYLQPVNAAVRSSGNIITVQEKFVLSASVLVCVCVHFKRQKKEKESTLKIICECHVYVCVCVFL